MRGDAAGAATFSPHDAEPAAHGCGFLCGWLTTILWLDLSGRCRSVCVLTGLPALDVVAVPALRLRSRAMAGLTVRLLIAGWFLATLPSVTAVPTVRYGSMVCRATGANKDWLPEVSPSAVLSTSATVPQPRPLPTPCRHHTVLGKSGPAIGLHAKVPRHTCPITTFRV